MFRKTKLSSAVITAITAGVVASHTSVAFAQLEEVLVTATKRSESTQDIPVTVSAITSDKLDQLGISNFEDYIVQMPGVTAGGAGPGRNTVYIRGVASTTPNLTTSGVAGLAPNVAMYLDEQPLTQPGRNLDVYVADMNRVEVLAGPQGTLFGASSQAGVIRLITNKPETTENYGRIKAGVSTTEKGDDSNNIEAVFNWAVSDSFALRGVVYRDDQGGYIDNVQGTRTALESARFRNSGVVRSNGVPVSDVRAGVQTSGWLDAAIARGDTFNGARVPLDSADPASYANINFLEANNEDLVEKDFNDTLYEGFRLSGLLDISDDWSLLLGYTHQEVEADGVFSADPTLGSSSPSVQRFSPDTLDDEFDNFAWTLSGRVNELEIVYTGAYTERESDQIVDYTDYLFVGQYLPYYICDSTVTYPEYNYNVTTPEGVASNYESFGTCQPPDLFVSSVNETTTSTHELRFSTDQTRSVRLTAGVFYSDQEIEERVDFVYPNNVDAAVFQYFGLSDTTGFPPNFPHTDSFRTAEGPYPAETIFRNDIKRTDEQIGIFGELSFDVTDNLTLIGGARYYDVEVKLKGGANASFCNSFQPDVNAFGTNISDLYNGDGEFTFVGDCNPATHITFTQGQTFDEVKAALNAVDPYSVGRGEFTNGPNAISTGEIEGIVNATSAPDSASEDGVILKGTIQYTPSDDSLIYFTYSEGYRPGLLNRPGGAPGAIGSNYVVPFELQTDEITNYELGWKTDMLDGNLRFNGSVFFIDISNLQTTIFDPSITNLFFSDNAADAEVLGLEGDLTWLASEGLTVGVAFSFLDSEITKVLIPTNDVKKGDSLAFAPEFQGNAYARYEWNFGSDYTAHVMGNVNHSDEMYSDIIRINRDEIASWTMAGLSAGVTSDTWGAELFVDNVTDERAEIARDYINDRERVVYARPRTMGLRFTYDF